MIISVNYQDNGAQYAMMTYCTFTKDGAGDINGVHVCKQVVLVSDQFYHLQAAVFRLALTFLVSAF